MVFDINEWLGDWISFEQLIRSDDPHMIRAWRESTKALGRKPLFALMMLGDARRFWGHACRTASREQRVPVTGWHIEALPSPDGVASEANKNGARNTGRNSGQSDGSASDGFVVEWLGDANPPHASKRSDDAVADRSNDRAAAAGSEPNAGSRAAQSINQREGRQSFRSLGRYTYRLDHMLDKGLEGKPCYVFHAVDVPERSPFRVLVAMDPMPERAALTRGGLLSHLHFQYASRESALLKGEGAHATLRKRMWYPTMCAGEGDLLAQCNIVRALHQLPAWQSLSDAYLH